MKTVPMLLKSRNPGRHPLKGRLPEVFLDPTTCFLSLVVNVAVDTEIARGWSLEAYIFSSTEPENNSRDFKAIPSARSNDLHLETPNLLQIFFAMYTPQCVHHNNILEKRTPTKYFPCAGTDGYPENMLLRHVHSSIFNPKKLKAFVVI